MTNAMIILLIIIAIAIVLFSLDALPADVIGIGIMIALIIDSFLDPIMGQVSDNWRSRWGRRHPFMYTAALPVALSYLLLWNPPHGWSHEALFVYLIVVAVVIRSFITLNPFSAPISAPRLEPEPPTMSIAQTWKVMVGT